MRSIVTTFLCLLPSLAFAQAQGDFPVVTNFPAAGGTMADPRRVATPDYENYSAEVTDEYLVTRGQFDNAANTVAANTGGLGVRFWNSLNSVQENQPFIQIVSNVPIGAALYTIGFPPNWNRNGDYAIFLSPAATTYSNNRRLFAAGEVGVMGYVASRGLIVAFSNVGGIESQGVSDEVLRSVGAALDQLATYGGDKQRVITGGFSRGAGASLIWAANPLNLDYNVVAVFAHALPVSVVEAVTAPYATYPHLGFFHDYITNNPALSQYNNDPPPHSFPNRMLQIITGQGTAEAKSALVSIDRLAGKELVFSAGTHDAVLPFHRAVEFSRALFAAGVQHTANFIYNEGHQLSALVAQEFVLAIDVIAMGQAYRGPRRRIYSVQNTLASLDYTTQQTFDPQTTPFSAVLPYRSSVGQPLRIDLCGTPGTSYRVCAVPQGGQLAALDYAGTIPPGECTTLPGETPGVGLYDWRIEVGGMPVARSLTPITGILATFDVRDTQQQHLTGLPSALPIAHGISELSPQPMQGAATCPGPPPMDAGVIDRGVPDQGVAGMDASAANDGGTASGGDASSVQEPREESGCGCNAGDRARSNTWWLFVLPAMIVLRRRVFPR